MKEWYAELADEVGRALDPWGEDYPSGLDDFYDRVSEYLGGEGFTFSRGCETWGL